MKAPDLAILAKDFDAFALGQGFTHEPGEPPNPPGRYAANTAHYFRPIDREDLLLSASYFYDTRVRKTKGLLVSIYYYGRPRRAACEQAMNRFYADCRQRYSARYGAHAVEPDRIETNPPPRPVLALRPAL